MSSNSNSLTRRGLLGAFGATCLIAAPRFAGAASYNRGAGDLRRLKMYNGRTGESINMVYFADGQYIREAMEEISIFMRDWRTGDIKAIDPRTIDILAASYRHLDVSEPYLLISGYRSPKTNAMLSRKSSGVAKKSLHMSGMAADVRLSSRSVNQIARAAMACEGGGVGKYSRSDFVHMDCGRVRTWGS